MKKSQFGMAGVIEILVIAAVIIVLATVAYLRLNKRSEPKQSTQHSESSVANQDKPPLLLKSIGVELDEYKASTGRAGDFKFTKMDLEFGRLLFDFGFQIPANSAGAAKANPQPTFILPLGTKVRSIVDGVVVDVGKLYSGDYSIKVADSANSQWLYEAEHVIKPLVKKNDEVVAGQVIAQVSNYDTRNTPGFGLVEIGILHGGNPPQHVCPFAYLDPSIKDSIHRKLLGFYSSWEDYTGNKKLYPAAYKVPGCLTLKAIDG